MTAGEAGTRRAARSHTEDMCELHQRRARPRRAHAHCIARGVALGRVSSLLLLIGFLDSTVRNSAANADEAGSWEARFLDKAIYTRKAACLDGSPPVYWISKGWGDGADRWLIFHEGGAWCISLQDCVDRATDRGWSKGLGSSKGDRDLAYPNFLKAGLGLMDRKLMGNPMANWNYILLRYCDGFMFAGDVKQPIEAYDSKTRKPYTLHFRGFAILQAIMDDLMGKPRQATLSGSHVYEKHTTKGFHPLAKATEVVVSGGSAGGLAVMLNCDLWAERLAAVNPDAVVRCMADSAWFQIPEIASEEYSPGGSPLEQLDPVYRGHSQGFMHLNDNWRRVNNLHAGTAAGLPRRCVAAQPLGEFWRCTVSSIAVRYVTNPLFVTQSAYDSWQGSTFLACTTDYNFHFIHSNCTDHILNAWGAGIRRSIGLWLSTDVSAARGHGAFVDACYRHDRTTSGMWKAAASSQTFGARRRATRLPVTGMEAMENWRQGRSRGANIWTEPGLYPCKACCKSSSIRRSDQFDKILGIGIKALIVAAAVALCFGLLRFICGRCLYACLLSQMRSKSGNAQVPLE